MLSLCPGLVVIPRVCSLPLCFLIHIIHDMLSWVCKMSEHMELDFLTNILAPCASGYPCLSVLRCRFGQEASFSEVRWVPWKERLQSASHPLRTRMHTLSPRIPLGVSMPMPNVALSDAALPGILRCQENESSCFPLHRKAGPLGTKGHYQDPPPEPCLFSIAL